MPTLTRLGLTVIILYLSHLAWHGYIYWLRTGAWLLN